MINIALIYLTIAMAAFMIHTMSVLPQVFEKRKSLTPERVCIEVFCGCVASAILALVWPVMVWISFIFLVVKIGEFFFNDSH